MYTCITIFESIDIKELYLESEDLKEIVDYITCRLELYTYNSCFGFVEDMEQNLKTLTFTNGKNYITLTHLIDTQYIRYIVTNVSQDEIFFLKDFYSNMMVDMIKNHIKVHGLESVNFIGH